MMMEVKLYNSLTDQIEVLRPLVPGEVSLYVCGPTVYDEVHIGNLRPVVVFDTLTNFLSYLGYRIKFVSNYTDVDDRIIAKAENEAITEKEIADRYIASYEQNLRDINAKPASINPRVTEYMEEMVAFILELMEKGAAYQVNGNVYFRVAADPHYGELSNTDKESLLVGARIEENTEKESPLDFVLWKKTDNGIRWDSPWGQGRPGWHTECVVMIGSVFPKKEIDIHGGGFDLKFPHHENEIAQARVLHNNTIAQIWMHNGFINLGDQKMSKSLGNVVTARDALQKYGGNTIRLLLLETHYRAPVNFTEEIALSAQNEVNRILNSYKQLAVFLQEHDQDLTKGNPAEIDDFLLALGDDFNTPNAISDLFALLKKINTELRLPKPDLEKMLNYFAVFRDMLIILGIKASYPVLDQKARKLLFDYRKARAEKRYEESDELRAELIARNIL
ncbi:MAG: cysteine--tRNA ligase [Bacilli bacterium]|jgi:cysteinyl-tRNA synthetase